jgi:FMN phosphatase YigB (HAD superfamily)
MRKVEAADLLRGRLSIHIRRMRLAFDLDGTLADMQAALAREARELFPHVHPANLPRSTAPEGTPVSAGQESAETPPVDDMSLTARQQRELWNAVRARENFWETLDEIEPGVLARLASLARDRKWEVIFLTSRPETSGDCAQAQSHRWLIAHGFPTPSVFVVHGSRGRIAAALNLDVLVDDRPENCLDVAIDSSARAILVWRGDEDKVPASARHLGIGSVSSIAACLDILERVDDEKADAPGMVDRLKRLLGLKPKPARLRESPPFPDHPAEQRARPQGGVASAR